jgi:acyl-coenzyme A synthetase/AMP-(fatty) acid ligase
VKTAEVFPTIRGTRYVMPGDFATVEADGSITLLGRGSIVINSGGEKIFPEEVESAVRSHPDVMDAIVCGAPTRDGVRRWPPSSNPGLAMSPHRSRTSRSIAAA